VVAGTAETPAPAPALPPAAIGGGLDPDRDPLVASYYRSPDGFRPSGQALRSEAAPAPVSVVALLDSAALALPDTAQFEHAGYDLKFTPDMIGRPTLGAQVGGYYGN